MCRQFTVDVLRAIYSSIWIPGVRTSERVYISHDCLGCSHQRRRHFHRQHSVVPEISMTKQLIQYEDLAHIQLPSRRHCRRRFNFDDEDYGK